jgi:hypothetical protein
MQQINRKYPVAFDKDTHTYAYPNDHSIELESVTKICDAYIPELTFEIYKRLFSNDERALESWNDLPRKSAEARDFGTRIDALFQTIYEGKEPEKVAFKKAYYQHFFTNEVNDLKARYPEMLLQVPLCDPETGIAGTLDMCWHQDGIWYVGDLKTGRAPTDENPFGNFMSYPFEHMNNSYASKYALQVSLYIHLLRVNGNEVSDEITIFSVGKSGTIKTYKLWYVKEIDQLLEMRRFKI